MPSTEQISQPLSQPLSEPLSPAQKLSQATKSPWLKRLTHVAVWAAAEVAVNAVGLDTIADYAEFVSNNQIVAAVTETLSNLITMV